MILPGDPLALPAETGAEVLLHQSLRLPRDGEGVIRRRPPAILRRPFGDCEAAERLRTHTKVAEAEVFVLRLPEALLAGQRAFVTAAPHHLVTDSRDPGHRAAIYEAEGRRRFESVRLDHDAAAGAFLPRADDPPLRIEEEAAALTAMEGGNYGAFLLRCVTKLVALREAGLGGLRVIAGGNPWQAAAWAAFGLPPGQVIAHDLARTYAVRSLVVPSLRAPHFFLDDPAAAMFRDLAARLEDGAVRPERVYVSRLSLDRRRPDYRACANEAALAERMRGMGFHVVEPQALPFGEQVRIFAAARIVVGPGGAGMFNTVFCRPGTAVVSVESTTNWLTAHANLFASLGHDYALVVGGADPADAGPQRRWRMDVDCVVDTVSRMMA